MTRLLLRLYSRPFRTAFGEEALRLLRQDLADAGAKSAPAALLTRFLLLADFAAQGVLDRGAAALRRLVPARRPHVDGWAQDARLALRSALRRPGFVAVAVSSLAIGVGANTVVFAVVDSLLLRDIPGIEDPTRVVELQMLRAGGGRGSWDFPDFLDVREDVGLLESVAMVEAGPMSISDESSGERLMALYVTSGYFETFGVQPSLGRTFLPEEDVGTGQHPVAVLSHATWRSRFLADPGILGATVRLNRERYTVVGVAPESFRGHQFGIQPALYVPLTQYQLARDNPELFIDSRGTNWASVVGRMRPDVELDALNGALGTVMARLADEYPQTNRGRSARAHPAGLAPAEARPAMAVVFATLAVLMLLVLAATCANVGGMLLARAAAQERDMAVRLALGSGRGRLVRLLLFEAMVIFAVGGAGGVYLAIQGLRVFDANRFLPTPYPVELGFALDWRVLAFGLVLTLVTGLVFGLMPALQVTRENLAGALREHAGNSLRASRLRRVFVGGQVGVSILLLASAGLLLRSLQKGSEVEPGFAPEGVYASGFDLSMEGYGDAEKASAYLERLLEHLRARPDVAAAAVATDLPQDGGSSSRPVWPDGRGADDEGWIQSYYGRVTDGYFETLGIEVLAGRSFGPQDGRLTPRVAVVNELFAQTAWPDGDAVGRIVEFGLEPAAYEVVGVVANTKTDLITDRPAPQVFSLLVQDYGSNVFVAVRESGPGEGFVGRMRSAILEVDPSLALGMTRSMESLAGLGMLPHRIAAAVAGLLGTLAMFLSAVGVYGVVAFSVAQRTREIGVRIALGASRRQVLSRVIRGGLGLAVPGFAVGLLLAVALGHALRAGLVGVQPLDPLALGSVAGVLVLVISAASFAPARRASSIEPMDALRHE